VSCGSLLSISCGSPASTADATFAATTPAPTHTLMGRDRPVLLPAGRPTPSVGGARGRAAAHENLLVLRLGPREVAYGAGPRCVLSLERRLARRAGRRGLGAARVEPTRPRRGDGARHVPGEHDALSAPSARVDTGDRHRREKRAGVRVPR